jgi:hypothetical protein
MLANADFLMGFTRRSQEALKKSGLKESHVMPLAEALLIAEAIEAGKLELGDCDRQHLKDLLSG